MTSPSDDTTIETIDESIEHLRALKTQLTKYFDSSIAGLQEVRAQILARRAPGRQLVTDPSLVSDAVCGISVTALGLSKGKLKSLSDEGIGTIGDLIHHPSYECGWEDMSAMLRDFGAATMRKLAIALSAYNIGLVGYDLPRADWLEPITVG